MTEQPAQITRPLCSSCGIDTQGKYGKDTLDNILCYSCCGERDKVTMIETGKFVGYLVKGNSDNFPPFQTPKFYLKNWPGSLVFEVVGVRKYKTRGIEKERTQFRFIGPDGAVWTGRQMGVHNEIARCKRTKYRSMAEAIHRGG